ncbi:hypothetical protein, partial [Phormidium sp. CCY1219]|uniref:hypothetical protein n=1 Tax=Phormidium sp. CCY1219 TaxID=2886104 RepID=UPI002D1F3AEA
MSVTVASILKPFHMAEPLTLYFTTRVGGFSCPMKFGGYFYQNFTICREICGTMNTMGKVRPYMVGCV